MTSDNIPAGTKIGNFVFKRNLSKTGGTSSVYLGYAENTKINVVIKIAKVDEENKTTHEEMLLQWESELLQRWDWRHNGIVRVFPIPLKGRNPEYTVRAINIVNKPWCIVMEYLSGNSLGQNLSIIQNYSLDWKLELFYQILLPIAFIHQKGYAHRDIKPENIVFRNPISPNQTPEPVLVDFALATNGQEERTIIDNSFTLEYASPERILRSMPSMNKELPDKENVLASDIWSLGVLLYEILTGKLLFKGNRDKVRTTIVREKISPDLPITDERANILVLFIQSMLDKDPEQRPNIKQVIYALEEKFLPPRINIE